MTLKNTLTALVAGFTLTAGSIAAAEEPKCEIARGGIEMGSTAAQEWYDDNCTEDSKKNQKKRKRRKKSKPVNVSCGEQIEQLAKNNYCVETGNKEIHIFKDYDSNGNDLLKLRVHKKNKDDSVKITFFEATLNDGSYKLTHVSVEELARTYGCDPQDDHGKIMSYGLSIMSPLGEDLDLSNRRVRRAAEKTFCKAVNEAYTSRYGKIKKDLTVEEQIKLLEK